MGKKSSKKRDAPSTNASDNQHTDENETQDSDQEYELTSPHEHEITIKRSRFIARAAPVTSLAAALSFIEKASEKDARHNCWAYSIDNQEFRSNDDGEPGGTAGRPILSAIENSNVINVAVCVIRYFGGSKLGAGGLVRAYGGVTRDCLKEAEKIKKVKMDELKVMIGFQDVGPVVNVVKGYCKVESVFDEQGASIHVRVPSSKVLKFKSEVNDASKGRAEIEEIA